jgi:hypothetical protein
MAVQMAALKDHLMAAWTGDPTAAWMAAWMAVWMVALMAASMAV